MAIDYSKWDKLEISDDSDIEEHPNVDKKSMIRWRQQAIHEQRQQRNLEIKQMEVQIPMYIELNKRVDKMLADLDNANFGNYDEIQKYLSSNFDDSKPEGVEDDAPSFNEMIEDLILELKEQLKNSGRDPNDGAVLRDEVKNHRKKIDDVLTQNQDKLKSLLKERELHISSEDMHTGWDRSFLNKGESKVAPVTPAVPAPKVSASTIKPEISSAAASSTSAVSPASTQTATSISSATPVSQEVATTSSTTHTDEDDDEGTIERLHPDTAALSQIPLNNTSKIQDMLKSHLHIITESQKDALLMTAFDSQFAGNDPLTKQIIGHSTILKFLLDLIKFKNAKYPPEFHAIISGLFDKLFSSPSSPARNAYDQEIETTFNHIKQRCVVLSQEQAMQGEQKIQLKSIDDSSELVVNLPDPESEDPAEKERYEIFKTLPQKMQEALKSESLDAVNAVFEEMQIEEAEHILEIFDAGDIIGIQAVLENENEWRDIKHDYENGLAEEEGATEQQKESVPKIEELNITPPVEELSTADIVD
ncbi:hypothetical protein BON22_0510 [Cyberlindnera fabianii]|uniref:Hsp90 chaperone protein kinase-targeting subunit n=1 Tax=Cyberlindnera fabianii TaxID=36022 RepID=A0A1V2LBY2_CYBFA|nr:hypothetical protein BON22_0510 [Cyberlindnera fabianii]